MRPYTIVWLTALLLSACENNAALTSDSIVSVASLDSLLSSADSTALPAGLRAQLTRARELVASGRTPGIDRLSISDLHAWVSRETYADSVAAAAALQKEQLERDQAAAAERARTDARAAFVRYAEHVQRTADSVAILVATPGALNPDDDGVTLMRTGRRMKVFADNFAARVPPPALDAVHQQLVRESNALY